MPRLTHFLAPLLLLGAAGFLLFWKLGSLPVQQWDECRTGINALETLLHRDWLVMRYQGEPDLWNSKPPLHLWALSLSFATLGPTEFALRLPSALAALATVMAVYAAGRRALGSPAAGLLAGLILVTAGGFTSLHVARSGDFDAMLTLWTTLGTLCWLTYLRTGRGKWAWLTGLAFALALLTKGIAGALPGPGLLLAAWATGNWHRLRNPAPWLAGGLAVVALIGWYGLREAIAPGYLAAVMQYELSMATEGLENNGHSPVWYIGRLLEYNFPPWLAAAILAVALAWRRNTPPSPAQLLVRGAACVAGSHLLILSLASTKLSWYDAPIYPLLALLAGAGITWAAQAVSAQYQWQLRPVIVLLLVLLVAAGPFADRLAHLRELHQRRYTVAALLYGQHLRAQVTALPELRTYTLLRGNEFNDSPEFYRTAAQLELGHDIGRAAPWEAGSLEPATVVVACGAEARKPWTQRYETQVLLQTDSCVTLRLVQRR
ncbi:ArnT family glycosyltransferase [Hymenobacter koreensis]|uniref:Glycosyltransferase RgtA/B/C/D-like domain-containing protein n=1 Tax=Hymenobacter koreensis TaxID=1084523 RepID=A0ABP8JKW9_9BACT